MASPADGGGRAEQASSATFTTARPTAEAEAAGPVDPAEVVRRVRGGEIGIDEAVDLLVDRALGGALVQKAPESLKEEIRDALSELARDDPALAAFVRAMRR